jgi:pyruvate dehydrogenase E1 component alpha subunit
MVRTRSVIMVDGNNDGESSTEPHPPAGATIGFTQYLDSDGHVVRPLPERIASRDNLIRMYRAMVFTRTFDAKAVALQRTGRLGTFASSLGQEGVSVGIGSAMRAEDVLLPSFREQGAQFLRGILPQEILQFWGGDERGSNYSVGGEDFPICVPIGTHAPHAVGVALAFQLRRDPRVAVCVFGDGATSRGDVYESMNFAGVRRLPIVFIVSNNQWAISLPRSSQSAAATLAQKAIGCGFLGEQVDGNDVIAVTDRVGTAIESARAGGGPRLVEALTYRLSDHTTADDASRYRNDADVTARWKQEPVLRLRTYMVDQGYWSTSDEEQLLRESTEQVEQVVAAYLAIAPQEPTSMFDSLYAELPAAFTAQREQVAARKGGDAHG